MDSLSYRAVLERSDDGYNVFFPDFDGCTSWGASLDEAARHAADALTLFLDDWTGPLPTPSVISDPIDPEAEPAALVLVPYQPALAAA